jgi:hypothetical protein
VVALVASSSNDVSPFTSLVDIPDPHLRQSLLHHLPFFSGTTLAFFSATPLHRFFCFLRHFSTGKEYALIFCFVRFKGTKEREEVWGAEVRQSGIREEEAFRSEEKTERQRRGESETSGNNAESWGV